MTQRNTAKVTPCVLSVLTMILLLPALSAQAAGVRIPSMLDLKLDANTLATMARDRQIIIVHPAYDRDVEDKDGNKKVVRTQFVSAAVLIRAPMERVRAVIGDYDRYEEFLPQTKDVKILKKDGNRTLIHYDLNFEFSVISIGVGYDLEMREMGNGAFIWRLVKGDMAENYGSWEFLPVGDGQETIAIYTLWSDLRSMGFVVRQVLKAQPDLEQAIEVSTAALVSDSMRKRVESLYNQSAAAISAPGQ